MNNRPKCSTPVVLIQFALVLLCLALAGPALSQTTTMTEVIFDSAATPGPLPAKPVAVTLTGKVIGADGQPAAQTKVTLWIMKWSNATNSSVTHSQQAVVTGPDGAFIFSVETVVEDGFRWSVAMADKAGFAWGWASWEPMDKSAVAEIRLTVSKSLAGTVVDEEGKPVAGAQVILTQGVVPGGQRGQTLGGDVCEQTFAATTDGSGRFRLDRLPADASAELIVRKAGRATINTGDNRTEWTGSLTYAAGSQDIRITQPVEARIAGTVVEKATGRPVPGAKVEIVTTRGNRVTGGRPVSAKEDGTFAFQEFGPGSYVLRTVRGQATDWAPCSQRVTLEAGKTAAVRMELIKGGTLRVAVKESQGQHPIEKAYVQVRDEARGEWMSGQTDANGLAQIRLTPGEYQITGIQGSKYGYLRPDERISVEEGKTLSYEYHLTQAPRVRGVVLDPNRRPVEGISVGVHPAAGQESTTDSQGRFEAAWDPANWGSESQFCLVARDEGRNRAVCTEVNAEMGNVELQLAPGFTVTGRVVDPNNRPLAKGEVYAMLRYSNWGGTIGRNSPLGPDGRFSATALPVGYAYELMVRAPGYGQARRTISQDEVVAGTKDVGDLQLPLANLSITGVVVDANGEPASDVALYAYGTGQPDQRDIRTDSQGRFTIKGVCDGPVQISANAQGPSQAYGVARTEGGAKDVKIVLGNQRSAGRPIPIPIPSLKGRPLPDLKTLGVTVADVNDKPLLICFVDIEQRPSRKYLSDLAKKTDSLKAKGIQTVVVQTSKADLKQHEDWLKTNQVAFPIQTMEGDFDAKKSQWGAKALPWLILADKEHKVVAEGFAVSELDKTLSR